MPSRWIIAPPEDLNGELIWRNALCRVPTPGDRIEAIPPSIARLLLRRGFANLQQAEDFLRPRLKSLSDPFLLPNMNAAVARIFAAVDRKEVIVLFGDYDVDGVTSLALLAEILRAYGGAPDLFLPLRMEEGYGLSRESVERCCEKFRPQLLIALDCGTSSHEEIRELATRGVDVIILDHHQPKSALPDCVALINPKIDPSSPFHYLCSVGIVFKLCHALLKTRPLQDFDLKSKLDLVALGTVADIVPLRGENRTFVQFGAIEIARSTRPGLRKLVEISGLRPPILAEDIAFRLGPRLNAAGRLSTAEKSLALLLTQNESQAGELAEFLDQQNRERQNVEREILQAAEEKIACEFDPVRDAAIVIGERGWHPGVLGIVASRIGRKHHRPVIVIGFDENGLGKGSGRSIEGLNLVEALTRCAAKLEKYGGHEMAAGLTIRENDLAAFAKEFRTAAREILSDDDLQPRLQLDHELSLAETDVGLLSWHEMLQPFGNGNPQPTFFAREVQALAPPRVINEKHLALRIGQGKAHRRAIFFDGAAETLPPEPWDIAFRIRANNFGGMETLVELQVTALRQAARVD
ncbi:MAG TPA: single-stranded-DNA-specific exonuclease RecJ [Chthoniobacterales bacterium]|nr:single-stranded-DNA-specific exonuclease RecJ [Chthoniobacterales bacterium]